MGGGGGGKGGGRVRLNPPFRQIISFYRDFSEITGKINNKTGKINKSNTPL